MLSSQASTKGKKKEIVEIEVETDTEEEEMIEKEVEKKIIKEFKVPQVVAKHAYDGEGLSMKKGEVRAHTKNNSLDSLCFSIFISKKTLKPKNTIFSLISTLCL